MSGKDFLVIGYGNTLRRDDGVGVKVAEAVAEMDLPGVSVIARHQLVPELAGPISQMRGVIFVDANAGAAEKVEFDFVEPSTNAQILAHAVNPSSLLALAKKLFGKSPKAWTLAIPAEDFGFGDGLSPRAEEGFRAALAQIRALAQDNFCEAVANAR